MTKLLDEIQAVATGRVGAVTSPLHSITEDMGKIPLDYTPHQDCLEYKIVLSLEYLVFARNTEELTYHKERISRAFADKIYGEVREDITTAFINLDKDVWLSPEQRKPFEDLIRKLSGDAQTHA